jgi:hypothetical protein
LTGRLAGSLTVPVIAAASVVKTFMISVLSSPRLSGKKFTDELIQLTSTDAEISVSRRRSSQNMSRKLRYATALAD